ncbi:GNAT family N-acetyltransferase [Paucibacter sp. Y2R2-4]|uniref:GNAT family N-acetyltransferase n=1 Tax=Paucibacter sp. Y2R2-4 TaxID=2893553 RepID=UPI0021E4F886|nr:GNAT family N-acetyltransferase [Paucibacter sp. Y2R2-4]MCV2350546.1 GNAT family N-acetyltransferase [Paucibacter sp. Y2R2-4]
MPSTTPSAAQPFVLQAELPSAAAFKALYDTTGWGPVAREAGFYQAALAGSWRSRSAYLEGHLVGLARVISDGHLHAFITEMIVHPEHQGQGIGSALLRALLQDCLAAGVTDIQLFCAKGKSPFYVQHGFISRPDDAPGMQYRPAG